MVHPVPENTRSCPHLGQIYHPIRRSPGTTNLKLAKEELVSRKAALHRGENPYAEVQLVTARVATVGKVLDRYAQDGYTDRRRSARPELMRDAEAANVVALTLHWASLPVAAVSVATCERYHAFNPVIISDYKSVIRTHLFTQG